MVFLGGGGGGGLYDACMPLIASDQWFVNNIFIYAMEHLMGFFVF